MNQGFDTSAFLVWPLTIPQAEGWTRDAIFYSFRMLCKHPVASLRVKENKVWITVFSVCTHRIWGGEPVFSRRPCLQLWNQSPRMNGLCNEVQGWKPGPCPSPSVLGSHIRSLASAESTMNTFFLQQGLNNVSHPWRNTLASSFLVTRMSPLLHQLSLIFVCLICMIIELHAHFPCQLITYQQGADHNASAHSRPSINIY